MKSYYNIVQFAKRCGIILHVMFYQKEFEAQVNLLDLPALVTVSESSKNQVNTQP